MSSNTETPPKAAAEEKKEEPKPEKLEEKAKEPDDGKSAGKSTKMPENNLSVDPDTAYLNPGGGVSTHMLVNTSDRRMAVKIRCSDNHLYRVNPVAMFIETGQCQSLTVTRLPGPAKADKLIVQFIVCGLEDKAPKDVFSKLPKDTKPETLRISLKMADQKPKKYTSLEVVD